MTLNNTGKINTCTTKHPKKDDKIFFTSPTGTPETTRIQLLQDTTKTQNIKIKKYKKKLKFPISNAPTNKRWWHFSTIIYSNIVYTTKRTNIKTPFLLFNDT